MVESLKVLLMPLLIIFGLCAVGLTISALRNRVMFKMGARNLPRRPASTVLICLGLMLAAMIFSASFATGDTLTHSLRTLAVDYLGETDIMVMREGVDFGMIQTQVESSGRTAYFNQNEFDNVNNSLSDLIDNRIVDGIAPAIIETVPVVAEETGLNEPIVTLLGFDHQHMASFAPLVDGQGEQFSLKDLEDLGDGYVYVNTALAEELQVGVNDQIDVYLGAEETALTIAGIYETGGNPTTFSFDTSASMVVPLSQVQSLRADSDINFIIITNRGGTIDGAEHTDAVMAILEPMLEGTGLKAEPIKQDALDDADEGGATFSTMFLVFGSFSIIAGILLIFLIFVMMAAERKQELGIARAVGAQRRHIIRLFTYEGMLYALVASAIGSGLGLLFSWGMVRFLAAAFEEMGFDLVYHFTTSGLILSYTLGVVFTLVVVFFSARRVSRLNIICAIKDIPEPQQAGGRGIKGLVVAILLPLLGLLLLSSGLQAKEWTFYALGASLMIIGLCMLARRFRLPDRAAYTLAGVGLLAFWLTPWQYHPYAEEMSSGFEMFILIGVMLVAGGVWVVMYNLDLLLRAVMSLFGRLRALTPMIKTAISYPMASRFRTGMAVAMFSLVIFTLVIMSTLNASFDNVLDDTDRVAGGFHIRGEVNYNNPIPDIETALGETGSISRDDFQAIGSFNITPAEMRDVDELDNVPEPHGGEYVADGAESKDREWEDLYLVGVDTGYTENVSYEFELMTEDYASKDQVWKALSENPSLAVVSAEVVPSRDRDIGDNEIGLVVGEGQFYIQDDALPDDVYLEVMNPFTGAIQELRVIGVVDIMAGPYTAPVTTSQETVNALAGFSLPPTAYRFQVKPERVDNVAELARNLEKMG
jgi:putative ABC transport system permease protein